MEALTVLQVILILTVVVYFFVMIGNWTKIHWHNERSYEMANRIYGFQNRELQAVKREQNITDREEKLDFMYDEFADKQDALKEVEKMLAERGLKLQGEKAMWTLEKYSPKLTKRVAKKKAKV